MWILPKLFYQAKKTINDLGLGYNQFDACTNDCMLYIQEREKVSTLHIQYLALLEEKATPEATNQSFNNTRKILSKFCGIFFWYQGFKDITWKKNKTQFHLCSGMKMIASKMLCWGIPLILKPRKVLMNVIQSFVHILTM